MKQITLLMLLLAVACREKVEEVEAPVAAEDGWTLYGAAISDGDPMPAAKLMAEPDHWDGKTVLVEGTVDEVCKKKGCWLTMRDGDKKIRVRFKDYGFFVPLDCEERTVRLEGVFAVKTISEADVKHYLEDAGKHDEAKKHVGDQKELSFMASGAKLKS